MKMGNIASPWRYDGAARHALQSAKSAMACDFALRLVSACLPQRLQPDEAVYPALPEGHVRQRGLPFFILLFFLFIVGVASRHQTGAETRWGAGTLKHGGFCYGQARELD
jgi:hypothetical protein